MVTSDFGDKKAPVQEPTTNEKLIAAGFIKGRPIYATIDTQRHGKRDRNAQIMSTMSSPTNNASTTVNLYG